MVLAEIAGHCWLQRPCLDAAHQFGNYWRLLIRSCHLHFAPVWYHCWSRLPSLPYLFWEQYFQLWFRLQPRADELRRFRQDFGSSLLHSLAQDQRRWLLGWPIAGRHQHSRTLAHLLAGHLVAASYLVVTSCFDFVAVIETIAISIDHVQLHLPI